MTWQPINTAPKDGTEIDLWCIRKHCHGEVAQVRKCDISWGDIANTFTGEVYQGWRGLGELYAENTPTHWMLKPAAPEDV